MDSTIMAAIIGGVSTVLASVGTLLVTRILHENPLYERSKRQRSLGGRWEGTVHQEVGPEGGPIDILMTLTLKPSRRVVSGEGSISIPFKNEYVTMHLSFVSGGFIFDRFLKMEYEGKDVPEMVLFGVALIELSSDGQRLDGYFLGFGTLSSKVVFGTVQLHRTGSIAARISASTQATI